LLQWLARHQAGDFMWKSHWKNAASSQYTLLTHNMPFDIYSTRHSCGPNPNLCQNYDFTTYQSLAILNSTNFPAKVDDLVEQYAKTASLFTHNVAFVLVGSDFTYSKDVEFDQQYAGYKKIIDHINMNSKIRFNGATAQFGTPIEYFREIQKRQKGKFPSLVGDFFPYADIFSSGTPAYWTGYFSTRPFFKLIGRYLEHHLRNAEILFTVAYNKMNEKVNDRRYLRIMEKSYEKIIEVI
jgi:alpha-mannosidase